MSNSDVKEKNEGFLVWGARVETPVVSSPVEESIKRDIKELTSLVLNKTRPNRKEQCKNELD